MKPIDDPPREVGSYYVRTDGSGIRRRWHLNKLRLFHLIAISAQDQVLDAGCGVGTSPSSSLPSAGRLLAVIIDFPACPSQPRGAEAPTCRLICSMCPFPTKRLRRFSAWRSSSTSTEILSTEPCLNCAGCSSRRDGSCSRHQIIEVYERLSSFSPIPSASFPRWWEGNTSRSTIGALLQIFSLGPGSSSNELEHSTTFLHSSQLSRNAGRSGSTAGR